MSAKKDRICKKLVGNEYLANPDKYRYYSERCAVKQPVGGNTSAISASLRAMKSPPTSINSPINEFDGVLQIMNVMPRFIVAAHKFMKNHTSVKNIDERYTLALQKVPNGKLFTQNEPVKWSVYSLLKSA